jgi:site-specific DNA-methyltransferase (adenine-specific)
LQLIELEENIRRKDLSPIDKASAIAALHNIRKHENPTQTVRQTAVELAEMRDKGDTTAKAEEREISDALLLSNFTEDSDVRAAKTKKDALRIARKKLENNLLSTLGSLEGNDKAFQRDQEIITGDALLELDNLPDDSCDILLFDPPYGMGAHTFGEQTSVEGHEYEDTPEYSQSLVSGIIARADRVLKETAAAYIFCDIRTWRDFSSLLAEHGWYVWQTPLIWDKGSMGHCPRPGFGPKRSYEAVVYAFRGDYRTLKTGSDVLRFHSVPDKSHAAEKPVDLLKELLSWGALAGAVVLDPTCGSGSTLVAAHELNMAAIGIEKSEKFANIARARLAEASKVEEATNPLDALFN